MSWINQKGAKQQAHLVGHSASEVLQHIQHLEDVKSMHHVDPLESSCLKGWKREGGALDKREQRVEQDEEGF